MTYVLKGCPRCQGDLGEGQCIQCGHEAIQDKVDQMLVMESRAEFLAMINTDDDKDYQHRYKVLTGRKL